MRYQRLQNFGSDEQIIIRGNESEIAEMLAFLAGTKAVTPGNKYRVITQYRGDIFTMRLSEYPTYTDAWEAATTNNKKHPHLLHFVEKIEDES